MKLSIIIPTLNSSSVIRRAIDSIICQTFTDWEVLVMDGVSCDDTVLIAKSYQDCRIKVYSEPDKGIYDAMNKGIDKAQGEWLYFLGSDDWLYNSSSLFEIFENRDIENYDVIYGKIDAPWNNKYKDEWTIDNYLDVRCHQAIFYKRSFFGNNIRYNLKYKVCADRVINLRWFLSPEYSKKYYPVIVAHYSLGGFSDHIIDEVYDKNQARIVLKYGHSTLPVEEKKKLARWYMSVNPNRITDNLMLIIYVAYLRLKSKYVKLLHII